MKKRKRVSLRLALGIPLDLCWNAGTHTDLSHVHNVRAQEDMGDEYTHVHKLMQDSGRWCKDCVLGYNLNTPASRAFYEVVRLNKNEFTGNLPPEIIEMIYGHLLKKPLLFKECLVVPPAEKIRR